MKQLETEGIRGWRPQSYFRHTVATSRQMDTLNDRGGIAVEFREAGSWEANKIQLEGSQSETLSVWQTRSTLGFTTVPKRDVDVITIRFVVSGRLVRRDRLREYVGIAGFAMFVPFEAMLNEEASDTFYSFGGTITRHMLLHGHRILEGDDKCQPDLEPITSTAPKPMQAFMQTFRLLIKRLQDNPTPDELFLPLQEEIAIFQLLTAWPRRDAVRLETGALPSMRVQLALEFIEANLAKPIKLEDIARVTQSSVRSIQKSFHQDLLTSPTNYILRRRLEQVRRDLAETYREEYSVADVARRWGFVHISAFSQYFREHYGYSPRKERRRGEIRRRPSDLLPEQ